MAALDPVWVNNVAKDLLAEGSTYSDVSKQPDNMKTSPKEVMQSSAGLSMIDSTAAKASPHDPLVRAEKYLSKHNILELFQYMTSDVAYRRPHNVIDHMIDYITRLQEEAMVRKGVIVTSLSSKNS